MAYGVGVAGEFAFDVYPTAGSASQVITVTVERVTEISRDEGPSVRDCTAQNRTVHIVSHRDYVAVQIDLALDFNLRLSESRIDCRALNQVSESLLRYWILQQIIPLFLLLQGSTEFLHGMAISSRSLRTDGTKVAFDSCTGFLGESYAGKSTLLSFFLSRGHALVTDDHLALSRKDYTQVLPAPPYYRPYRAAEDLGVRAALHSAAPSTLRRLYLLQPAAADAPVRLESLSGMAAVAALFLNVHYSLHNPAKPDFFSLVEERFRGLADLVRRVPFARLHVPRSLDRLPEVYDFIQNDELS